ncbi:hypothetical protein KIPB_014829, partial [Kipferlia bialata]
TVSTLVHACFTTTKEGVPTVKMQKIVDLPILHRILEVGTAFLGRESTVVHATTPVDPTSALNMRQTKIKSLL